MKVCCSTGKARVYYQEPSPGGVKIRLNGETKWKHLSANEQLQTSCKSISGSTVTWTCPGSTHVWSYSHPTRIRQIGLTGGGVVSSWMINCETIDEPIGKVDIDTHCFRWGDPPENISFASSPDAKYSVKVTGKTSGDSYLDIEVNGCPDIQDMPCKWGKEKHIDVELPEKIVPWLAVPPNIMEGLTFAPFVKLKSCVEILEGTEGLEIWIKFQWPGNYAITFDPLNLFGFNKKVPKNIQSPSDCPKPKVRIECAPGYGIPPGEDKKCPKETTCQRDCNGYRCCYYKGKLIKTIKL